MKINESRNRRMLIMEQISIRQNSREKSRKSSAERRRKVEQSLTDFMKTMSDVFYARTGGSEAFKFVNENLSLNRQNDMNQKSELKKEYDTVLRSPSFKDINILDEEVEQVAVEKKSSIIQVQEKAKQQEQKEGRQIQYEEIKYNEDIDDQKKVVQNKLENNQSSASAIFFTSQFNQFITQNHLHKTDPNLVDQNVDLDQKPSQLQVKQPQNVFPNPTNLPMIQNDSQIQNNASLQLQIKQNLNLSINQQSYHPQLSNLQNPPSNQNQNVQEITEENKLLIKNKSGHSLAFSNESSLKYSLYESNIKQIIAKKFTHQLIVDTNKFDLDNQNSSLFQHLKFQILVDKKHLLQSQRTYKSLLSFFKLYQLNQKVIKRQKTLFFQAFIINQQLNLIDKKNQIKANQFLKLKQQSDFRKVFDFIKQTCFNQPKEKYQKAILFHEQKQNSQKQKIFRCFKIAWFDQKVKKQIDLYYLSKIFTHFVRVTKRQKQLERKKYLSFYCFNLKKRFFRHLKEGVDNLQLERIQRDNASWHYSFGLQRKVFDAWKQKLAYKDRYISLAMTTKNTFKQTADQRWLQIKTVDFRQIK